MQVPRRLSLMLTVALLVGTLAASGTVGARMLAKRRAAALALGDAHRSVRPTPSAALPEASADASAATEVIEGRAHTSTATRPPSHTPADPEHALPTSPHSEAVAGPLPHPLDPVARSMANDGAGPTGVAPAIATASGQDWEDEERPPPGPPPPASRPGRPRPAEERARPATPGTSRAPLVVPRSVNEWGT